MGCIPFREIRILYAHYPVTAARRLPDTVSTRLPVATMARSLLSLSVTFHLPALRRIVHVALSPLVVQRPRTVRRAFPALAVFLSMALPALVAGLAEALMEFAAFCIWAPIAVTAPAVPAGGVATNGCNFASGLSRARVEDAPVPAPLVAVTVTQ